MKSLIKFFPVAVGVLALASCSNDDFFGSSKDDGKLELVVSVAAPAGTDDGLTRSLTTVGETTADYQTTWQSTDVFRVYDAQLQKYDAFSYKAEAGKVTIDTDPAKVTEYAKAIFPGNNVSYAGWNAENDAVTATVKIEPTITYKKAVKVGTKTAYASNIPMWGDATMSDDHLSVNLNPLVSYTDIAVYGGAAAVKYIRVISTNATNKDADAAVAWGSEDNIVGNPDATSHIQKAPLTGYFDALLVTDGKLVANLDAPLADKYGCYIKVDLSGNTADEAHVIVPIVAQKYDVLLIQYYNASTSAWVTLKEYTDITVPNNNVIKNGLTAGTSIGIQEARVSTFADINARLTAFQNAPYSANKILNIELASGVAADAIKTSDGELNQTIKIPNYNGDKIINLNFDIDDTDYNLTIENLNEGTTVLNLQTIKGNMPVTIKQGGYADGKSLTITGEINSTGNGENKRLIVKETGDLLLGLGEWGPFKSNMNLYLDGTINENAALTIAAAEGNTIPTIDAAAATNTSKIDVVSGTVNAIGGKTAAATPVTVEGGTVTTLTTTTGAITVKRNDAAGTTGTVGTATAGAAAIDIQAGSVEKVTNGAAKVTVAAGATVGEITTASAANDNAINANVTKVTMTGVGTLTITDATVGELNVNVNGATINLAGTTKLAQITNLKTNKTSGDAIKVSSTGEAAILAVSADARFTFNNTSASTWNGKKTAIGESGNIYTAAQLASVTTGKAYKLMATTYNVAVAGATWTPLNISKNFDGNSKTIKGLNAPLFGTISGGTVKKLTLEDVTIASKAANQGALAQIVDGEVNIEEITVSGTSSIGAASAGEVTADANSKNIGGLVGKAKGTVALKDNKVTATVQGYANVGGYIGNFESGKVTMTVTNATSKKSTVAFKMTYKPNVAADASNANYGTFGYFIGSITGESQVEINKTGNTGTEVGHYFDTTHSSFDITDGAGDAKLCFKRNKKIENNVANAWFKGMTNHEFGYSAPGSIAAGKLVLYQAQSGTTDEMGLPITTTTSIDNINVFVTTEPELEPQPQPDPQEP